MQAFKSTRSDHWMMAGIVCAFATILAGCCQDPCCSQGRFYETRAMPCHGYHSTCWRQWPMDCCACPPYTAPPPNGYPAPPQRPALPVPPQPYEPVMPPQGPPMVPPQQGMP